MSISQLVYPELFPNFGSTSVDEDPDTSSSLFPTLRTYLKSPSREIEQVRKDQAAFLSRAEREVDEVVQGVALKSIIEIEEQLEPLEDRIKATKFFARLRPNTRLGLHSEIEECRHNLVEQVGIYRRSSDEAAQAREKKDADRRAQERLQKRLAASGSTAPRQSQQEAQPTEAYIPTASNVPISRAFRTNTSSDPNTQREADSRILTSPSTQITTATEGRHEEPPPSYTTRASTSERGHELGLSAASPQYLSPTYIQSPHEVQNSLITQPTRSAGPSLGSSRYIRPLPNPPAVPPTGTPALPGVDALAVTPGQTRSHSKTVSQSPSATRTTRPAGGRAPTQNHSSRFVEPARAQSQQATRPTYSNHVSADTVPSQSTDHRSSPGHGREFQKTDDDGITHSFSHDATASDDRAFHLNPSAVSVKASDAHDQASATTSSHISQRHSSVPAASQPKPSNQRNTPNSSVTPVVGRRQRSASQALKPSWTRSSMGSQDRRVHDKAVGQSPHDLESGQLSQGPTVPLRQPPLEGLTPTVQVDRRSPPNSSTMPIASPRQRSASEAPQSSSTQSYMRSRDRRVHDEALGQSLRNLESGQLSQGPTVPLKQPPVGGIKPTLQVDQRKPSNSSAMPIASPRQRSASQAPEPSSTQSYTGSRYRRVHDEALGQSPRNLESGQISQDPTIPPRHPPLGSLAPTLRTDNEPEATRPTMRVKLPIAGSERGALPLAQGVSDAFISNPAPHDERPRRSPHTVPGTGQTNSRREPQAPTSISRAENSAPCARYDPSGLLPRTAESRRTSAQVEPTTQGGIHRREIAGSEHATLPLTQGVSDAFISNPAPHDERPRRSPHTVPGTEPRIVRTVLDVIPVDAFPEPLNRDTLQRRWSLPPKAGFIDETPPCRRFLRL
ncbi:hypothetical protein D9615_008777 [Tricholomella constricta]|uniref:Uncharacterized protein n=1 Tax=Tricholomella constricta TaxID=117010 RepID=A0A8H5H7R9_9AGAR|nr:hypothetical protein D9615_008777 [Tricholomella constricta]